MCAVSSGMIVYVTSTLHGRICTYLVHIVRTSQGFCMCLCVHISNSQTTYERKKDNNSRKTKFLVCFVSRRKPRSCSSAPASSLSSASSSSLPLCAGLLLLCCSAAAVWSSSSSSSSSSSPSSSPEDERLDRRPSLRWEDNKGPNKQKEEKQTHQQTHLIVLAPHKRISTFIPPTFIPPPCSCWSTSPAQPTACLLWRRPLKSLLSWGN